MENSKHTVGTWTTTDNYKGVYGTHGVNAIVHDPNGKSLPVIKAICKVNDGLGTECYDNAKLIATAPEMLQALTNVLDDLNMFGKVNDTTRKHVLETIKKAIK